MKLRVIFGGRRCRHPSFRNSHTCSTSTPSVMSLGTDWELVSSYAGLLALAVSIIYSGSYGSLPVRRISNFCVMEAAPPD